MAAGSSQRSRRNKLADNDLRSGGADKVDAPEAELFKESQRAGTIFLFVVLAVLVCFALVLLKPFFYPLFFAFVIALGCHPLYQRIHRDVKSPGAAALLATLVILLGVAVPLLLLLSLLGGDLINVAAAIRDESTRAGGFLSYLNGLRDHALTWVGKYVNVNSMAIPRYLENLRSHASSLALGLASTLIGGAAGSIANTILTLIVLFFFFRDGSHWLRLLAAVIPLKPQYVDRLFKTVHDTVVANLYGIFGVALAQGVLMTVGLLIARIGNAVLLGMLAAIASVVPAVGTALVWVPAVIYLFATHHSGKGTFLLIWCVALVGTADNVIRPLVVRGRVEMHFLLLIFALLGGVVTFGLVGLFIGPLVFSLLLAVVETLRELSAENSAATSASLAI
jgi:predicted PurR-regulated permease PerM